MEENNRLLDKEKLKVLTEGDLDLTKEIIQIFLDVTPTQLDAIKNHFDNEQWGDLHREIHKYHTQLKTFSSHPVIDTVYEIEMLAKKGENIRGLSEKIDEILQVSESLLMMLKKELVEL